MLGRTIAGMRQHQARAGKPGGPVGLKQLGRFGLQVARFDGLGNKLCQNALFGLQRSKHNDNQGVAGLGRCTGQVKIFQFEVHNSVFLTTQRDSPASLANAIARP